jgi:hypothetical protein
MRVVVEVLLITARLRERAAPVVVAQVETWLLTTGLPGP